MTNLDILMASINKKYKENIVRTGSGYEKINMIPFSSPRANYLLYGGIPLGRSTEFFGREGSGKTTSAIDIVKNAQILARITFEDTLEEISNAIDKLEEKNNKSDQAEIKRLQTQFEEYDAKGIRKVVYVDAENTFDEDWARLNGVDVDSMILIRPSSQTCEQVLQMVLDLIKTDNVILIVIDSIPMLVPQQLYEETLEKKSYCGIAGTLTTFSARVAPLLSKHNTALIGINQSRDSMDEYAPDSTPGGRAWKHLQALRIEFRKGSFIDEDNNELKSNAENPIGNLVMMTIRKTKVAKPDRRLSSYTLRYDIGIDLVADTISMAIFFRIIQQGGAWFNVLNEDGTPYIVDGEPLKFQGKAKLIQYFKDNTEFFNNIHRQVNLLCN